MQAAILALIIFPGVRQSFGQSQYVRTTNLLAVADANMMSGNPDANLGNQIFVTTGVDSSGTNRGLFRFDLSRIPTNATVTNVTLKLVAFSTPPSGILFGLSLLLTNWDEYWASWNSRYYLTSWTAPGGQAGTDFYSFPSALATAGSTTTLTDNGSNPFFGLVHDVQTWVSHPAQNFGWMLAAADESSTNSLFLICSREFFGIEPVLTVGYTQPFTPPFIQGSMITNGVFQFSFNVEPYHGYVVQRCSDLAGTNWVTVIILDPPPWPTETTFFDPLTISNCFYRVVSR